MRRFSADYLRETRRGMWDGDREALAALELGDCESVLDVGCGEGALTRVLAAESGSEVVGCDRDAALLGDVDGPVVQGDAYRLPFDDDSVDLVVCQALLVNLTDPARAIAEFDRVARKRVACIEPDNGAVSIESTVDSEAPLASRARRLYLAGADTDVALGEGVRELFVDAGFENVSSHRHEQTLVVEPPYFEVDLRAAKRKASGAGLRSRRGTLAGSDERLDDLRSEWREMGRTAVRQIQSGEYRRRETVPFYVTVGSV